MINLKFLKKYLKGYIIARLRSHSDYNSSMYKDIGILNPSIATSNNGDKIIYSSVYKQLRKIYPNDVFTDFPTQIYTSYDAMDLMSDKDLVFISGTNLLSSNMETRHQWKIHKGQKEFLKRKVVLLGCGWWQYQDDINNYTKDLYKSVLNDEVLHAARDQYTVDKFKSIGINNVVNTTCPTLWDITPEKCMQIPVSKGKDVVTTLTFYKKNARLDSRMLELLSKHYDNVYLWFQGLRDSRYFEELNVNFDNLHLLPPTVESFDKILKKNDIDYIGTRLHGGIKALQHNVRTLIIAVDNRATEIGNDVNLNVLKREKIDDIVNFIHKDYKTEISLPQNNIDNWKRSLLENQ